MELLSLNSDGTGNRPTACWATCGESDKRQRVPCYEFTSEMTTNPRNFLQGVSKAQWKFVSSLETMTIDIKGPLNTSCASD